ncbi:carbohydrate esterase family 3 protein [Podospora didyma]|uniref:Carbohydrate esterase family 3 protein n=1 Tax=Podospora didyma TaxID=330526 RepID=A0AAE0NPL6_9PEZI|nr:carbohydrate esterase family 3 protein [Podospora didyma]
MPLGASITFGVASSDFNGYRKHFRDRLRFAGWRVNMVGTQEGGSMSDRQSEGHPGWEITQVRSAAETAVNAGIHPNLILINVGTNDCRNNNDPGNAGNRMKSLIDYLYGAVPATTILLSTLVPNKVGSVESCVVSVNNQFRSLASTYIAAGRKMYLADMHAFLNQDDISGDGIHPTDFGYKKMASVWWDAFLNVEAHITAPDNSIDDAQDALLPTCAKVAGNGIGPVKVQRGSGFENGKYLHSSTARGIVLTETNPGVKYFHWANLVNAVTADRGAELDDLVQIDPQTGGNWRYRVRVNRGGGVFDAWATFSIGFTCSSTSSHQFGDFDNDGLADIWCINTNGAASVAINQGGNPPTFTNIGQVMSAKSDTYPTDQILLGDIDGDGRTDYCLVDNNGNVRCWRNGGTSSSVSTWQGFSAEDGFGGVVFPAQGMGNRTRVRLGDLNGDFRTDWMWIGNQGQITTFINQRGWGTGIVPNWVRTDQTHGGMGVDGAADFIKLGRVYGSGRLDYTDFKTSTNGQVTIQVWENKGDGGTRVRGDGSFYCDMTGDGSEDYVWIWSDGHAAELYINNHNAPYWQQGSKTLFNIARSRRSIKLADWNGDGRCDVLSQRKSDGALEMWRNDYDPVTQRFTFTPMGFVTGPLCSEGWGVNVRDHGMQLADIDGDGRADALCLEKNGRVTGWLNKASGMENVNQIKYTEGWDRANIRFADVEHGGKADLVWINKYNGEVTVLKNKGRIPASGSSFTWEKRGVLYSGVGERGANVHLVNLGGLGRADLLQVLPISNRVSSWLMAVAVRCSS